MIPPEEQTALATRLMRDVIDPDTRPLGVGAILVLFPFETLGTATYIANGDVPGCRAALRSLLDKWDAEDVEGGK